MLNLQWRLRSLDPDASESLRVIAFFDALGESNAGVESLLRAAAALADGDVACIETDSRRGIVARPSGEMKRETVELVPNRPSHAVATDPARAVVLDRRGDQPHANDELLLERLAICLRHASERSTGTLVRSALEVLIDPSESAEARSDAAGRLRLEANTGYRLAATPFTDRQPTTPRIGVVFTPVGMLRAHIVDDGQEFDRAGVSSARGPDEFARSWQEAVTCLRLTTVRTPVVRADDYGSILELRASTVPTADQERFGELLAERPWAGDTAEVFSRSAGARDAARVLGVHHSTVQWRVRVMSETLGYDVVGHPGRLRLAVSDLVHRLTTQRF